LVVKRVVGMQLWRLADQVLRRGDPSAGLTTPEPPELPELPKPEDGETTTDAAA
jgi:hypothetical protein